MPPPKNTHPDSGEDSAVDPLTIDPPADGEVVEFEARIRVTSRSADPYGLGRLRKLAPLLDTSDIHVDRLRYVMPAAGLPDPRAGKLLAEAERLRRESDASRREAAEIIGRNRHRRRGAKKQQPIRNADWSRDGDDQ